MHYPLPLPWDAFPASHNSIQYLSTSLLPAEDTHTSLLVSRKNCFHTCNWHSENQPQSLSCLLPHCQDASKQQMGSIKAGLTFILGSCNSLSMVPVPWASKNLPLLQIPFRASSKNISEYSTHAHTHTLTHTYEGGGKDSQLYHPSGKGR